MKKLFKILLSITALIIFALCQAKASAKSSFTLAAAPVLLVCGAIVDLKHFKVSEFDSPDAPGSGKNMKADTLQMLDLAREISGVPYAINSGYRTQKHNKEVGGKADSAHTKGFAADIKTADSNTRFHVIRGLLTAGFRRIGVGKNFVHADNDPSLPQKVLFHYY